MITVVLCDGVDGVDGVDGPPVGGTAGLQGVVKQGEPAPCKSTTGTSSDDEMSWQESELAASRTTSGVLQ